MWRFLNPRHSSDIVVFYSGHGVPGLKDRRGYLLPADADPDSAEINGYPIDVLYTNLGKLGEARSVQVFLDACFSGDSDRGMLVRSASPVYVQAALPGASGDKLTVLAAASGQEVASWDDEARHGLFTHHLMDALYGAGDTDGDGRVTAAEVKLYLDDTMTLAARREFGRHQNASLNGVAQAVLAAAAPGGFPQRPVLEGGEALEVAGGYEEVEEPAQSAEAALVLTRAQRVSVQRGLSALGYDVGPADGLFGSRTRAGIEAYQKTKGLGETGYLTAEQSEALVALGEEAAREAEAQRKEQERLAEEARRMAEAQEKERQRLAEEAQQAEPEPPVETAEPKAPVPDSNREAIAKALSKALSIAEMISDKYGSRTRAFAQFARAQAEAGDIQGAERSIAKALSGVERLSDKASRSYAFALIARAQAGAGDTQGAERSIAKALSGAERLSDEASRSYAFTQIARAQAEAGDIQGAERSIAKALSGAERLSDKYGSRTNAFALIAQAQAEAGDIQGAERSIAKALSGAERLNDEFGAGTYSVAIIARVQAEAGDIQGAERSIAKALSGAERLSSSDEFLRSSAFTYIARAQAEAGDIQGAERSIAKALSGAERLSGIEKDIVLRDVPAAQARIVILSP